MRLAKFLAHAGVASRRTAERMIAAGRVTIAGEVVTDPARDISAVDSSVAVDGKPVVANTGDLVVYMLNKPPGVVSTATDTHGRPTVLGLVTVPERIYPIGRLDLNTTGLLLLTNDGDLAYRLTHPSFHVPKTYVVTVAGAPVSSKALQELRTGIELDDGITAPAEAKLLAQNRLELIIQEGRKRQIRRMCKAIGHPVIELQRIAVGPLQLGGLELGDFRLLAEDELQPLRQAAGLPAD